MRNRKEIQDSIRDWSKDEKVAGRIIEETIALHSPKFDTKHGFIYLRNPENIRLIKKIQNPKHTAPKSNKKVAQV